MASRELTGNRRKKKAARSQAQKDDNLLENGQYERKKTEDQGDNGQDIHTDHEQQVTTNVVKQIPLTPYDIVALRRIRLNRLLMRKRRHGRFGVGLLGRHLLAPMLLFFTLFFALVSSGAGAAYAYYQAQLPLLNGIAQHSLFQSTHIYDRNGKLLYELYDHRTGQGRRTYINYNDISHQLVNATVAAEDHSFWANSGVDYYGIARAAVSNIQNKSVIEGGSTITQQLIKNQFFLGQPRNFQVKGEEAILATGLTQQYPKWKIMEMYLNTVYYGDLNYGVEAAAEDYFGLKTQCNGQHQCKPAVAQLDLGQASLLAGLPQSPSSFNPVMYKQRALDRQQQVLQSMVEQGMITPQEKLAAGQEMQYFRFRPYGETHPMEAPHFVNYVMDQVLVPLLGAQNLENNGYNIYTSIDLDLEKKVEGIVYNDLYGPQYDPYLGYYRSLSATHNVNNAAVVVLNPANGEILAMDGSASTDPAKTTPQMQGDYNAALAVRQPGSSFKPFVYATAFELGWYPAMIVPDHKTYFPNSISPAYSPPNYDGTFHTGYPMTVRTALANSFNIPAVDAFEFAGAQNVANMTQRLGLSEVTSTALAQGPSTALGTIEVSPLHMTSAYATFANRGVRVPTTSILKITDSQGRPLYQFDEAHPHGVQVMRADVAYLMSSVLSDKGARYHEFGPGNPLELSRPAAAKTGTTDKFRDNWTVGYTPHLAVGVWAGNSDNSIMNNIIGITGAGPIWHDVTETASQYYNLPPDDFSPPANVHQASVSALTGLSPRPGEPTVTDWFIDGTLPTIQSSIYSPPPVEQPCLTISCILGNQRAPGNQNSQGSQGNQNSQPNQFNQNSQPDQNNQSSQGSQSDQNNQNNQNSQSSQGDQGNGVNSYGN